MKKIPPQLLLVEGKNDQHVLRNLLRDHQIPCVLADARKSKDKNIVIQQAESIEKLLGFLEAILVDGDLQNLGILVDADKNIATRWESIRNILVRFGGQNTPSQPSIEGTYLELIQPYRTLSVGIWLMPDNQVPGILEDFISFLIPNSDEPLWKRAQHCVNTIPANQRHFRDIDLPKAYIHTWLAWQKTPGLPYGTAITAKYLDVNAPHALKLVNWVKRVFDVNS